MRLRSSRRVRPFYWESLPAEIRLMILNAATQQKYPGCGWASLASVCKAWQSVVEKRNFQRLNLRVSCLEEFENIIGRPRELVRHICLDVELRKYTCKTCDKRERTAQNSVIFTNGVKKLLRILGSWKLASGLTLELNAYSPSDSDHWNEGDAASAREIDCKWHDPEHGWVNGRQITPPSCEATLRLFELLDLGSLEELAPICVTGLIRSVSQRLPHTLKRVSVFEDFSDDIIASLGGSLPVSSWASPGLLSLFGPGAGLVSPSRVVKPQLGAAFARRSLDLEQLSVSYMVNAEDFFRACTPTWTWQRLESLALTSQQLRDIGNRQQIDALLADAGVTALQMPKLHTLVLWNGQRGNACAFIYQAHSDHASITWRGTWDVDFDPAMVDVWRRVAFEGHSRHALQVRKRTVKNVIESHGDAICHLKLPCQVVTPTSLWQIRKEHEATGHRGEYAR
ncbi:hypothetical protein B0T21DRAFT_293514 [Apiosordaria backusii]|uniref:DUF6546 domain-containing protein n=1 Tax=Apiosordaria backusii TaxID=314023 RepID=A0AA40B2F5_9PEZI|nr:hypothetical protein B0T21DRAFT_293514 [Apiosordaria backusii]